MKTQILQGINLENNFTTIKISFEKRPDTSLIEEIKNYHPIFLKSYKVNGNDIIIQSKLPLLWKEIAKILGKEDERKLALEIIKNLVSSMSTIPVLDVADKMNEEITPFLISKSIWKGFGSSQFNRQYCIGCGKRSALTISFSTSKDSRMGKQIQSDKYLTNRLMDRLSIPGAPWENIKSEEHLKQIFENYKKPVVIKPTAFTGGRGVHTKITTIEQALEAYKNIVDITIEKNSKSKIIIQEQIEGEDYRILTVNGKLQAATKRMPASVQGDGQKTIKELIETKNKDPRRDINSPTHTLKPINIDKPLIDCLQEQQLNLKYIPKKGEEILVRKVASMSQGGTTVDFTDKVHKQIKILSETLAHSLRVYVLGIDVICKDISKPLTKENGGIIEVNTMPEAYLNMFPVLGPQRPQIAQEFVDGLLTDLETKKVVIIGGDFEQAKEKIKNFEGNTGLYSSSSIYINGELIEKNLNTDKAVQALKINSYLNNIVFHYASIEEVEKYGFGFDQIDMLYLQQKLEGRIKHIDSNLIKKCILTQ
jgi:D-alanine-D-alanine ligase-like ATP-grasp enzyme